MDCATQLLSDRAQTWWDIVKERRATETLRWRDFRTDFENQYYSCQHRKIKEQEFLALTQGDMTVLEYERRFQDLSIFASVYLPTEQHRNRETPRWTPTGAEDGIGCFAVSDSEGFYSGRSVSRGRGSCRATGR